VLPAIGLSEDNSLPVEPSAKIPPAGRFVHLDDARLAEVEAESKPLLAQLDELRKTIEANRPMNVAAVAQLERSFEVSFIYHSNAIEGNRLTRNETDLVLQRGITVGSKALRDHLEAVNLGGAINFIKDLSRNGKPFSEADLLELHRIVLKGIEGETPGYFRTVAVRISGTDVLPTEPLLIPEEVGSLLDWLNQSHRIHPVLLAAGAHWWFARIHPFHDGNGRVARLLTNFVLLRNGYPIAIVREDDRKTYYDALAKADKGDPSDFCEFIIGSAVRTARLYEAALSEQKRAEELLGPVVDAAAKAATQRLLAYYQVWQARMETVKDEFKKFASILDSKLAPGLRFTFEDFGIIDFEKFRTLLEKGEAERTWYFRVRVIDVTGNSKSYVFWFSWANQFVETFARRPVLISLHISERRGDDWVTLEGPGVPELREIFEHQDSIYQRIWLDREHPGKAHPISRVDPASLASKFLGELASGL
jgi:Fic family protein